MSNLTHVPNAAVASQNDIDLSDQMDSPFDTREGVDPVRYARHGTGLSGVSAGDTILGGAELASNGQVSSASAVSGGDFIGVTGPYTVALGRNLDPEDVLEVNFDGRGEVQHTV